MYLQIQRCDICQYATSEPAEQAHWGELKQHADGSIVLICHQCITHLKLRVIKAPAVEIKGLFDE